jgi:ATP-dependent helicase IRC3
LLSGLKAPVADYLSEEQLQELTATIESQIFYGHDLYPGYSQQDVKDIVQYYYQREVVPSYIELHDRARFDVTNVAQDILAADYSRSQEEAYKSQLWDEHESQWKTFFAHDKRYFLNEVDLAIRRISNPDLYKRPTVIPTDRKELRRLEELSMGEIREQNPRYWKWLSDRVYEKHQDEEGYYKSAEGDYRSKNKLDFQLDHITAISQGGLTTFENLQLLTRKQNAGKGAR